VSQVIEVLLRKYRALDLKEGAILIEAHLLQKEANTLRSSVGDFQDLKIFLVNSF